MSVRTIPALEVFRSVQAGVTPAPEIIDVRTPVEYEQLHVVGAQSVPLDGLDPAAIMNGRAGAATARPLYVICKAGGRAAKACEQFQAAGFDSVLSIEGGTEAWEAAGLPVVRGTGRVISLERQVRIAAGSIVLLGILLSWLVHPAFLGLVTLVGTGLIFAGITDWCGMGLLLGRMRWNNRGGAQPASAHCKSC
jgi:rhodanese-related sulfurtransferase